MDGQRVAAHDILQVTNGSVVHLLKAAVREQLAEHRCSVRARQLLEQNGPDPWLIERPVEGDDERATHRQKNAQLLGQRGGTEQKFLNPGIADGLVVVEKEQATGPGLLEL